MNPSVALKALLDPALSALVPDAVKRAEALNTLTPSGKPEFGDFQLKCAMGLGKALDKKPHEVAAAIVAAIPANDLIETAVVAGPGFVNVTLKTTAIAAAVQALAADPRLGVTTVETPQRFVVDYSGPNVAKPLHVGHLRSTVIGDALVRILTHLGHTVVGDNHLGDWGTQFGMLIYGYRTFLNKDAYKANPVRELARLYLQVRNVAGSVDILSNAFTNFLDKEAFAEDPVAELTRVFVNGTKRAKSDENDEEGDAKLPFKNPVADAYRLETAKLHAGDVENRKLWAEFMPPCMDEIHRVYAKLDIVPFTHLLGESHYQPMLDGVVNELLAKGVAEVGGGGAVIIKGDGDAVTLIRKRDGAFTYTTTDLATIQYRVQEFQPDTILYVVDFRQGYHFKNLFAAARKSGVSGVELQHVSFGSVLGKDGKPIKTRDGGGKELGDLIDEGIDLGGRLFELSLLERKASGHDVPEVSDETLRDVALAVGVGAIKFADLSTHRTSDYKFDFATMLATKGNTATYMQYAYARCRAIFRKGDIAFDGDTSAGVTLTQPAERALGLQLLRFGDAVHEAAVKYEPHHICAYLWDLSKAFSTFFEACPVLTADTPELKASRLLLVHVTARTIQTALSLLGIRTVDQM